LVSGLKGRDALESLLLSEDKKLRVIGARVLGQIRDPRSLSSISASFGRGDESFDRELFLAMLNYDFKKLDFQGKTIAIRAFEYALLSDNPYVLPTSTANLDRLLELTGQPGSELTTKLGEKLKQDIGKDYDDNYKKVFLIKSRMAALDAVANAQGTNPQKNLEEVLDMADHHTRQKVKILAILLVAKNAVYGDMDSFKKIVAREYQSGGETTKGFIGELGGIPFFRLNGLMDAVNGTTSSLETTRTIPVISSPEDAKREAVDTIKEMIKREMG
ncbi:MAG: hypothetical protein ABIF01_04885, partial [Candidatus Micrarchaeota archaeon]